MILQILIFAASLFLVVQGATLATKYSAKVAERFNLSQYIVGFIIVAFISILPETVISISSAIRGMPEFGLGTIFGSNIADLTLIFAIMTIVAGRGLKIESKVLKDVRFYPFLIMLPVIFGLNGHYSRLEGIALIVAGVFFYYLLFKREEKMDAYHSGVGSVKNFLFLVFAMVILLLGSQFTVNSATEIAEVLNVTPVLIAMLVVSIGTTMPELFYSLKAVRKKEDGLAVGDILGTVMADATIVVGVIACISPFYFPAKIVYVTGTFMVIASFFLMKLIRSERVLTRLEGFLLLAFWIVYAVIEFLVGRN
ncbi:MAG: sodium:calcium antiporter [Parcubacteria group bacterium]